MNESRLSYRTFQFSCFFANLIFQGNVKAESSSMRLYLNCPVRYGFAGVNAYEGNNLICPVFSYVKSHFRSTLSLRSPAG